MHESVPRSTTGSSVLVMVAERHGVPEDVALRGSGVSRELLDSPTGEVSREQEVAIVSNIVAQLDGSVGVGAEVGMHYHLKTFGVWGFALLSSPTLRSALQTGVQFLDLTFALSRIAVREIEEETRLYFDVSHLPPDIRGFVLERDGLGIRTIQLELLGEVMPLRRIVTQQAGTAEDQELLSQLLQADVTMNAPVTFASFDRDLLDQPVLNSDPTLAELAVQQCEQTLAARRSRVGYAGAVREALIAGRNRWADIGAIAATLHLSERTLQRRLIEEGTSFRDLVAEVREALALELLATGMPVFEVSQRLGYVEVSSFSQAFRRWKGVGPSAFRSRAQSTPWGDTSSG